MNNAQFSALDLNLLKVLMALLARRSVTAAASDLALSPSAVSHALNRLRAALDDPLFERRAGGLVPTAYAIDVGKRAGPALEQMRAAVAKTAFDASSAEREFVIAAGTYAASVLLPHALARIHAAAPGVTLRVKRIDAHYVDDVEQRRVDLALGVPKLTHQSVQWRPLLADGVAWAARRNHPFMREPVTAPMLAGARHVVLDRFQSLLSAESDAPSPLPDVGAQLSAAYSAVIASGRGLAPVAIVSDMGQAIDLVRSSDFVTLTMRKFALAQRLPDLAVLEPPHRGADFEIGAAYHPARLLDGGLSWLLDIMAVQ